MQRQFTSTWKRGALSAAVVLGLTGPAYAVDGVIEINQVLAKAGGVTPGDTPLFPVTISQAGSYRLTSNLDVTDASARPPGAAAENTTAIEVKADNVSIDLNGFMIKGPTVCSGSPLACSPTGGGNGIDASSAIAVAVVNGTVKGMGYYGLILGSGGQAEKIRALSNGGGIWSEAATTVTNCIAYRNGGKGIQANVVTNCAAGNNRGVGILASNASGCNAFGNEGGDIAAIAITGHNVCGIPPVPCP